MRQALRVLWRPATGTSLDTSLSSRCYKILSLIVVRVICDWIFYASRTQHRWTSSQSFMNASCYIFKVRDGSYHVYEDRCTSSCSLLKKEGSYSTYHKDPYTGETCRVIILSRVTVYTGPRIHCF